MGIAYVAAASLKVQPWSLGAWSVLVLGPILLAFAYRRTNPLRRELSGQDPSTLSAARAAVWGSLLWLAARTGPPGHAAFDTAANLGTGTALVASLVALARIPAAPGLLAPPRTVRSLDAAGFAALLFSVTSTLSGLRALDLSIPLVLDPLLVDYATTTVSIAGLLLSTAASVRLRLARRLELGIGDRASVCVTIAIAAPLVAIPAALLDILAPDRTLPAALLAVALSHVWVAATPDAARTIRVLRGTLAIAVLAVPILMVGSVAALRWPSQAAWLLVTAGAASVLVGLYSRNLARPLAPEQARWMDAIVAATEAALEPDPDDAIRSALVALSPIGGGPGQRVELWRRDPPCALFVDVAQNLQQESLAIPDLLYELSANEPERTLRLEVLRAVQVRRIETRTMVSFLEMREVFSTTLLTDRDGALGLIALPIGRRRTPLALEEAMALRRLADRLGALVAVTSAQARSRQRELETWERATRLESECQLLMQAGQSERERTRLLTEHHARRIKDTPYSPASRWAIQELEQRGRKGSGLCLELPAGVDPMGWAAIFHLASPRANGPLVLLDSVRCATGTDLWSEADRSPLAWARGGTLLLVDAQALELPIQLAILRRLAQRMPTTDDSVSQTPDVVLALHEPLEALEQQGLLHDGWRRLLGEARVRIPSLAERSEDLRAMIVERAARLGLALRGKPYGVEPAVQKALLEYPWPGNDLQFEAVMTVLLAGAEGTTITKEALRLAGPLGPDEAAAPEPSAPVVTKRRSPGRSMPAPEH